ARRVREPAHRVQPASSRPNRPPIRAKSSAGGAACTPDTRWRCGRRECWGGLPLSNNVQRYREALMISKAELARKAGRSTVTIDRVEAGRPCRLDTKRKVLLALGLRISDKDRVFGILNDVPIASALLAAAETRS